MPTPLTPVTKKIVKVFNKNIVHIKKSITKVNKTIQVLRKKIPTVPVEQRPVIRRKIVILNKIVKKYVTKVNTIKRAVIAIRYPKPAPEVTPVTRDIVRVFKKTVKKNIKKIHVVKK